MNTAINPENSINSYKKKKDYRFVIGISIIVALILIAFALYLFAFVSPIDSARKNGEIISFAVFFSDYENEPFAAFIGVYSPDKERSALISVPYNMGFWLDRNSSLKNLKQLYREGGYRKAVNAISFTADTKIDFHIVLDYNSIKNLVDLIGGLNLFIKNPPALNEDDKNFFGLKTGGYLLDGDKTFEYLLRADKEETPRTLLYRCTDILSAVFIRFIKDENLSKVYSDKIFKLFLYKELKGNIRLVDIFALDNFFKNIKYDSFFINTMSGTPVNEEQTLLKPIYDGRYIVRHVKELKAAVSELSKEADIERSDIKVRVLNATTIRGLADKIKIRMNYNDFKAIELGNFGRFSDKSYVIIHTGRPAKGLMLADAAKVDDVYALTDRRMNIDTTLILGYNYYEIPR